MADLHERFELAVPYARAKSYLAEDIGPLAESGQPETLRLQVTARDLTIDRDVIVHYAHRTDAMHFDEPWGVSWKPAAGGPFPDFNGELTVRAAEDYNSAVLELRGEYQPPLGEAGKLFDAMLGNRIASNTAQTLLRTIASRMESRFQSEEERKPHG